MEYDPSYRALLRPAKNVVFFPNGLPNAFEAVCAEFSLLAYSHDKSSIRTALQSVGFAEHRIFEKDGTFAVAAHNGNRSIVVFRGTEPDDPADIVGNLSVLPVVWAPGGKVHHGFAKAHATIWQDLNAALANFPKPVTFTGHSLGGALATLSLSVIPQHEAITFGCPRVGTDTFAAAFPNDRLTRFENCCDLVYRVLPQPYVHVGQQSYIDNSGNISQPDNDDRAAARFSYIRDYGWRLGNAPVRDLADHSIANYIRALM